MIPIPLRIMLPLPVVDIEAVHWFAPLAPSLEKQTYESTLHKIRDLWDIISQHFSSIHQSFYLFCTRRESIR
jgi:hypothetical protein